MFDSQWLDIAIGAVFVWFLLALSVTAINEALARVLAMRSKQLWQWLHQMLDGTQKIQSVVGSAFTLWKWGGRPATSAPGVGASFTHKLYATETMQALETRTADTKPTHISNIPATVFSQALIELTDPQVGDNADQIVGRLIGAAPGPLKDKLSAMWASADHEMSAFTTAVEAWFDAQMARLSAIYKAQLRIILTIIGVLIAIFGYGAGLRTDSVDLIARLQSDSALRQVVVNAASQSVQSDLSKAGCPSGPNTQHNQTVTDCQILGASKLQNIGLVIKSDQTNSATFGTRLGYIFSHWRAILGVLITGLAISFGSTFWFDVLRKLVGIRNATQTAT